MAGSLFSRRLRKKNIAISIQSLFPLNESDMGQTENSNHRAEMQIDREQKNKKEEEGKRKRE